MRILIVGSGGREHAFAWKISQSPVVEQVFVAPGNGGTQQEAKISNIAIAATDIEQLLHFAQKEQCDLTLVGPEAPLSLGIVDAFKKHGMLCFGPSQNAAQLESSKAFAKQFMHKYNIPTASYGEFEEPNQAKAYLESQRYPIVIKADGLAAGKGVVIAENQTQAHAAIDDMLSGNAFGTAGKKIIIEEFLQGLEASFIVITDGLTTKAFATSQDHKALYDNDKGPNTGGMGAYSPTPLIDEALEAKVMAEIINPTLEGMAAEGMPYQGFLYAGLMLCDDGSIKVLEYNCRFGDPETQPILFRLKSDFATLCLKAAQQQLHCCELVWDSKAALCVVLAAQGYPGSYAKGEVISGLEATTSDAIKVFHAGTKLNDNGNFVSNGGRVLGVTAKAATLEQAQQQAYQQVEKISCSGGFHYRHDIGSKVLN